MQQTILFFIRKVLSHFYTSMSNCASSSLVVTAGDSSVKTMDTKITIAIDPHLEIKIVHSQIVGHFGDVGHIQYWHPFPSDLPVKAIYLRKLTPICHASIQKATIICHENGVNSNVRTEQSPDGVSQVTHVLHFCRSMLSHHAFCKRVLMFNRKGFWKSTR